MEDIDEELWESGSVVWAKVPGDRPWWPAVVFTGWDEAAAWKIPIPAERRARVIANHEAVGVLLQDYALEVFDKRGCRVQDWDYISPATMLEEHLEHPLRRELQRAINDARVLVRLSRGCSSAGRLEMAVPKAGRPRKKRRRPFASCSTKPRTAVSPKTAPSPKAIKEARRSSQECLPLKKRRKTRPPPESEEDEAYPPRPVTKTTKNNNNNNASPSALQPNTRHFNSRASSAHTPLHTARAAALTA